MATAYCTQVTPYWAVTYAPTPLQPANISNEATQLAQCLGFQDVPDKYQCRPQIGASNSAAGFDDCWKCPPKVIFIQAPHAMHCEAQAVSKLHDVRTTGASLFWSNS